MRKKNKAGGTKRKGLWAFVAGDKFLYLLMFLLFAPLFFHGPHFSLPRVKGGDEPHYLVILNSLLSDHDLELANNYDSVRNGSLQAGAKFSGLLIEAHARYRVGGQWLLFPDIYEPLPEGMMGVPGGTLVPKPGMEGKVESVRSNHPVGLPMVLATILWPWAGTRWVEPLALLLANLSILLSMLIFRRILRRYLKDPVLIHLALALVFLGTPLWTYGRTLFAEPFLALLALAAYWLVLEKRSGFWAGVLLGLGMFMKWPFGVMAAAPFLYWVLQREWRKALELALGTAVFVSVCFAVNIHLFGQPVPFFAQKYVMEDPLAGLAGLWVSWNHGLLTFSPFLVVVLFSWKGFLKERRWDATLFGLGFLIYYLTFAFASNNWYGGWCFGAREVVPAILFLAVPVHRTLGAYGKWEDWKRWVFLALCALSLAFNALGALDGYWSSHPLTILQGNIA